MSVDASGHVLSDEVESNLPDVQLLAIDTLKEQLDDARSLPDLLSEETNQLDTEAAEITGHSSGSSVFITSGTSTLSGMTITGGDAFGGGGINNKADGILTVKDSVVTGNLAQGGGGIYTGGYIGGPYSQLTVDNSTISDNTVYGGSQSPGSGPYYFYGRGGGIMGYRSYITVDNSTVSGNSAKYPGFRSEGGGIFGGTATISDSTISGNSAQEGSGVYTVGFLAITNSTIAGNSTEGIRSENNLGTVVANSTITNNYEGIYADGATLTNSIVAGNRTNIAGSVNAATSRNNLIGDPTNFRPDVDGNLLPPIGPPAGGLTNGVNGNIVGDPDAGLGALANNGGPTETCALFSYSPAINAGDNSLIPIDPSTGSPFTTDQTGAPRIFNGTVDIGAVEIQATVVPSTVVDTTTDDVAADGLTSLRAAIGIAERSGGVVTFDPTVFASPQTITLTQTLDPLSDGNPGELVVDCWNGAVTIDGPGADLLTVQGEPGSQVFLVTGSSPATISGMTITGAPGFGAAAGIVDKGNLTLASSVVTGNTGSGIINDGALTVSNSNISGNKAYSVHFGGGIRNVGTATISNSTISGNTAFPGFNRGGGIINYGAAAIYNSTISGNTAFDGGGIDNETILNSSLQPTLTISDSTISGNSAALAGGGISNNEGTATISDSTISGNTAVRGGGID